MAARTPTPATAAGPAAAAYGIDSASAEGQSARAHELLKRWRSRAATLVCSTASEGGTGRVATIFGEPGPADEVKEMPHWRAYAEAAPLLEERAVNEPAPAMPAGPMAGGVRTLREQSRCPFRGFAAVRLSAQPLELPQPGFTPRERGIILHRCLEHLWRSLRTRDALALASTADRAALVAAAAERAVGAAARERNPGEQWCDRERRRLEKVLPRWLELEARREPFEVEALESPGRLELAGLQLDLRIDRVDRLADGRRVLLDYKTSSVAADWYEDRPSNPQLPAYALASPDRLAGVAYAQVHAAKQRFCGVAEDARVLPGVATPRSRNLESASLEQELGLWRDRLEHIAAELRRGDARVAPSRGACDECLLAGLCRIVRAGGSSLIEATGTGEQD
ncbi:MAG: PD-(D/E)XK nuclease family protein [Steroidobacteraceae bacterium]